ncbi:MAG: lipid-A-disaccharide synthase [Bacteroidetes bacterium]|nr:MAG: lipid-A-disaccharide synthase [Bacteroidota bacterium]
MKYYIISGETSGDNHASRVMLALKKLDSNATFRGMGGDASQAAGQELIIHQKEMAIMGFVEIITSLRKIARNLKLIKQDIKSWNPDVVLLVDYPGFNFKIAKYVYGIGIPVHYYISPKVWAWKEGRVKLIKKYITKLYCILPFEEAYFKKRNVESTYVGNPSKETVDEFLLTNTLVRDKKQIALLPGSRKQEINTSLPIMLEAMKEFSDYQLLVAQAPGFDDTFYHNFNPNLKLIKNDMYSLLAQCDAALVTSGTATLETALMNVPQVVCYRLNEISYRIGKMVVKLDYISLVNLILDKPCVTELIQSDFNPKRLKIELNLILHDADRKSKMTKEYAELHKIIGQGHPSSEVASLIWAELSH